MTLKQVNMNRGSRIFGQTLLLMLVLHAAGCGKSDRQEAKAPISSQQTKATPVPAAPPAAQQTPVTAPPPLTLPPPGTKPLSSIESLVAPIALYPDPLLAEVLVAATYPLEVVQAARWLDSKADPATLRAKNWDASITRLTEVPSVLKMMSDHLDWTTQLGDAFLSTPAELMDAVQALRKRATDAGFLKDNEQQKVEAKQVSLPAAPAGETQTAEVQVKPAVVTKEVITIEPAKPNTLAVPNYNPEAVYGAPLAPPPATATNYAAGAVPATYAYPAAAPAPAAYYPTYYPPAQTTSSTDQWLSFGAGAIVGGLLTWGIMEWADDDWDDDHYHVSHGYGDAVCHEGNCWYGGGGGYGGGNNNVNIDRGDINIDREVNIDRDGNRIDREGTFKPEQLPAFKDRTSRWQPDARHRRGQPYPLPAQERLGRMQQPALAGSRFSGADNLPANTRGFDARQAAQLPAQSRLSSAEIQQRLAAKPGTKALPGKTEIRNRAAADRRTNALAELNSSGQRLKAESKRGAASISSRPAEKRKAIAKPVPQVSQARREPALAENRRPAQQSASATQRFQNRQIQETQRLQQQQRRETARPSAFESVQDRGRFRDFSNRGNTSRMSAQPSRQGGGSIGGRGGGGGAARGSGATRGGRGGGRR